MTNNGKEKKSQSKRREEFVKDYIRGSEFFDGKTPTEEDINRALADVSSVRTKKRSKSKRPKKVDFVKGYIFRSQFFYGEIPTKEDIDRTWVDVKNAGKKKRVKRNSKPEISKEEFIAECHRGSQMWNETPNEEEINRGWDLIVFERQYHAIRGKTKKEKEEKQRAFFEQTEQEMKRRYPSGQ